jgi:hypothetical protein
MKKADSARRTKGPGLKPLDFVDPLPRPKGRCYSDKAAPRFFQRPLKPLILLAVFGATEVAPFQT